MLSSSVRLSFLFFAFSISSCSREYESGYTKFPEGDFCFSSQNEHFSIKDGTLSTYRKGIQGVTVSLRHGAKTGDRFLVHDGEMRLMFDSDGEYLERGKTNLHYWRFGHLTIPLSSADIAVVSMQPGRIGDEVIFRQIACRVRTH